MNSQDNPVVPSQPSNSVNVVNNASTPISSDSPSNSYTVNHGNSSNVHSDVLTGLTNLCSLQAGPHALLGDDFGLSQEFKARLWNLFRQIETEFEKECKKIYSENYALHDRNEKVESSDHEETNFAKKISSSHFSQKIKQQYKQSKQSTSRLVSTFRDRGATIPSGGGQTNHQSNRQMCTLCWKMTEHRDGIWDVNCIGRGLVGTASADGTVRLWSTESGHCSVCYIGHSGSVNSVRFKNGIMLTASGDGTAHWVILPPDKVSEAMSALDGPKSALSDSASTPCCIKEDENEEDVSVFSNTKRNVVSPSGEESREANTIENPLMVLRNPNSMYQTASMYPSQGSYTYHDSAPLSAADFLSNRDQIVTAGWDRLGRIYDVATGSEVASLTGHDLPLTDVRTSPVLDHTLAVTASKDCTFRLWDFRCSSTEVHVQQGHNGVVSSVSFVGNSGEKLVSAGADRVCKLWDLRQNRNPLHVIRTDSPINRLTVHPSGKMVALPMDNRTVKIFDLNLGTRITRLPRSSNQSHSRIVTNVAWTADGGGKPNFFSVGFDQQLLAWNLQTPGALASNS